MTPILRIIACSIAGAFWLAAIIAKHFWPDIDIGLFCATCAGVIGALGIHGMASSSAQPAAPAQAGFASLRLLIVLAAVSIGLALSACTTTTASMYKGYTSEAVAGVKMWDDNALATVQTVLCAQPYSAIQRHPELQPGVQALCGPLANVSSLDANQLALLMQLLGKAGVGVTAVPAASAASGAK